MATCSCGYPCAKWNCHWDLMPIKVNFRKQAIPLLRYLLLLFWGVGWGVSMDPHEQHHVWKHAPWSLHGPYHFHGLSKLSDIPASVQDQRYNLPGLQWLAFNKNAELIPCTLQNVFNSDLMRMNESVNFRWIQFLWSHLQDLKYTYTCMMYSWQHLKYFLYYSTFSQIRKPRAENKSKTERFIWVSETWTLYVL